VTIITGFLLELRGSVAVVPPRIMRHIVAPAQGRLELCAGPIGGLAALDRLVEALDGQPIGRCPRLSVPLLDLRRRFWAPRQRVIQVGQHAPDQLAG
jgi:hypothetical protein